MFQIFSWSIADELLQQKRDMQSCYFAAQTMRSKIQNSFHELPDEAHVSLRDSLIVHISQINDDTSPVIVTQLCLALADLALLMSSWPDPVHDLIAKLSSESNTLWPLLIIVRLIPEEINSRHLRLGANRRDVIQKQLETNSKMVTELLVHSLTIAQDNHTKIMKCIKCFTSWISVQAIDVCDASNNVIIGECFKLLLNQEADAKMHDAAADLLCTLFECLESVHDQPLLETQLFQNVVQLESAYHLSVAHEDIDRAMNFCRIFTVMAETFLEKMIKEDLEKQPHYAIKSFDLVLNCVGHYDYEVAEITFNLWYRLSEDLYQKNNDALTEHFRPYIERLLNALYRLSQMEPDHEGLLDESDSFMVSNVYQHSIDMHSLTAFAFVCSSATGFPSKSHGHHQRRGIHSGLEQLLQTNVLDFGRVERPMGKLGSGSVHYGKCCEKYFTVSAAHINVKHTHAYTLFSQFPFFPIRSAVMRTKLCQK